MNKNNREFDKKEIAGRLRAEAGEGNVLTDEPMYRHTTFRIGGPADLFVTPETAESVAGVTAFCRDSGIPWIVMGNGSNLLVSDDGFRGAVIQIDRNMQHTEIEGSTVLAEAGAHLARVAAAAEEASLSGMEFASGIPGTVGGASSMNAGAYGGEMKDVISRVMVLDGNSVCRWIGKDSLDMGYRSSAISKNGWIVLEAEMELLRGERSDISSRMEELRKARKEKQPLEYASAGSTFKRPKGYYAGKLIMDAGLRGFGIGGARVSEKHCGFIINSGSATASDVRELIKYVQDTVFEKSGVMLEPEVKFIGF